MLYHVVAHIIINEDFRTTLENAFFVDIKLQSKIEVKINHHNYFDYFISKGMKMELVKCGGKRKY